LTQGALVLYDVNMKFAPRRNQPFVRRLLTVVVSPFVAIARFIHLGVTLNTQDDATFFGFLVLAMAATLAALHHFLLQ
jgi:hypothetical protein